MDIVPIRMLHMVIVYVLSSIPREIIVNRWDRENKLLEGGDIITVIP